MWRDLGATAMRTGEQAKLADLRLGSPYYEEAGRLGPAGRTELGYRIRPKGGVPPSAGERWAVFRRMLISDDQNQAGGLVYPVMAAGR